MNFLKKISILLALVLLFSVSFIACSTDEATAPVENQEEAPISEEAKDDSIKESVAKENEEIVETSESIEKIETEVSHENDTVEKEVTLDEDNEVSEKDEGSNGEEPSSDIISNEEESQVTDEVTDKSLPKSNDSNEKAPEEVNGLKVEGHVEKPLALSLDELKAMKNLIYSETFYSLNSFGTTEYTDFKGIKLWQLLEEKAHILEGAKTVKIVAIDGYNVSFTIHEVKRMDYIDETNQNLKLPIIIAWEENGEEYNPEEGPPYKLIIGQKEPGDVNKPQWVRDIDVIIVE